jgi:hypothetical protein
MSKNTVISHDISLEEKPKKRKGRKPKNQKVEEAVPEQKPPPKKRGRKPKGGKIIKNIEEKKEQYIEQKNVILHLKCSIEELNNTLDNHLKYNPNVCNYEPYYENTNYEIIEKDITIEQNKETPIVNDKQTTNETNEKHKSKKEIYGKLKELEKSLNVNDISKKSSCFWCTCDFNSQAIYIPSTYHKNKYDVYGCFCSPECACAHLFNENIDDNTKFERYQLLNFIYGGIYNYTKNIKPAPNPYYTLDKYYGNLTIQEYRQLLEFDRLLLVIDKPLTKVFPELHEDNNDFETIYENKITLKKNSKVNKNDVISKVFKN